MGKPNTGTATTTGPIDPRGAAAEPPRQLRKVLGRRDVLALAFGAIIGWGWVVLAGEMAGRAGTVGSALAFVVGAVMVFFVGLTYAELTSALSRAGGELSFTYLGIGPRASFVCGWTLLLAYVSVGAFEAVALPMVIGYVSEGFQSGYLYSVAGWDVHLSWVVLGVAGAVGIGIINYMGIRPAALLQGIATLTLLLIGLSFFIPGNLRGDLANLPPLFTSVEGFLGVLIMTPFLYLGFDIIPQIAEEIHVPFQAVGRLILVSILIALGWYVMVQWTVGLSLDAGARTSGELATADAMSVVYGSRWAGRVLVFGGLLGIITSWNAFFLGASRLMFAMSRGGMLPPVFSRLHPRYGSPVAVILLLTSLSALAPFFGRQAVVWLAHAGGLATVCSYLMVAISFLTIRRRYPDLPRPYRAPAPIFVGSFALLTTVLFVLLYLPGSPSALVWPFEWMIVIGWIVLGAWFSIGAMRRVATMGRETQARLIMGAYVEVLRNAGDAGLKGSSR